MKNLTEVQNFLSDIPYINDDGCAIAALAMYRWLKKKDKVKSTFRFVYLYSWSSMNSQEINKRYFNKESDVISSCTHAVILYRNQYLDCNGIEYIDGYNEIDLIEREFDIIKSINTKGCWNHMFDRSHISSIEKNLEIDLSEIIQ